MDGISLQLAGDDLDAIRTAVNDCDQSFLTDADKSTLRKSIGANRFSAESVSISSRLPSIHWAAIRTRAKLHISDFDAKRERNPELERRCEKLRREQVDLKK